MEQNTKRIVTMLGLLALTAAAYFLRYSSILAWGSLAVVAVFGIYAVRLQSRDEYPACKCVVLTALSLAAAGLALGAALLRYDDGQNLIMVALLAVSALCWAVTALLRQMGKPVSVWMFIIPAVFFAAELVTKFRTWGGDPRILDYCYELLALIATMCAMYHMGSFSMEKGQRRRTVFYAMCGVFFNGAALAAAVRDELCIKVAVILWLVAELWRQLKK